MKRYNRWNNIVGWAVFAVAALTYLATMEPSASLWDCSEFIATSYKLEVGHPPGAPTCTEREVSICAKDSGGPYNYAVTTALVEAAKSVGAKYAVDVYPHYGSDVEASLRSGWDVRHGLIGAGVYASHGYERSHIEGVENTLKLLEAYVLD